MANAIDLAKIYTPKLDEAYKQASLSSDLDGAEELMREGYNADEIVIPVLDMDGLADYSRNEGYVNGDVKLEWNTVKTNFDRGRMFEVDELDNIETGGVAFGRLAGEFIRTKVVPELDAFRFAKYASKEGVSTDSEALTTGAKVVEALRAATNQMDEDEVPYEDRHLKITPTLLGMVEDLDTTKSRAVLARFASITAVPQTRFYTAITQYDGKTDTSDQEDGVNQKKGGYVKAANAKNINFEILHRSALIQFNKLVKPKIMQRTSTLKFFTGVRLYSSTNSLSRKSSRLR